MNHIDLFIRLTVKPSDVPTVEQLVHQYDISGMGICRELKDVNNSYEEQIDELYKANEGLQREIEWYRSKLYGGGKDE